MAKQVKVVRVVDNKNRVSLFAEGMPKFGKEVIVTVYDDKVVVSKPIQIKKGV